jgi:4-amino-4-deoxy-L-arabinose transferase-like glycosyltransferase
MRTGGAFLEGFLFVHNFQRAVQPMEGHSGPIVYYPIALCLGFLPWSVLFGPMIVDMVTRLRGNDAQKAGLVLLVCWVWVIMGLFSIARTKLPSYITPCYPAMSLICASFLVRWSRGEARFPAWLLKGGLVTLVVLGVAILIGLPIAAAKFLPGEGWLGLIGLAPLAGGIAALLALRRARPAAAVAGLAVAAVAMAAAVMAIVPVRLDRHQAQHLLWAAIAERSDSPRLASLGCLEPSWVVYSGHQVTEIAAEDTPALRAFLASDDAFLITTDVWREKIAAQLPADVQVVAEAPYFLRRKQLVVLSRSDSPHLAGHSGAAIWK